MRPAVPETAAAALVGLCLSVLCACRGDVAEPCLELLAAEQFLAAAERCEQIFVATGDEKAGISATRANASLGNGEEVLAWVERLRGTSQEGAAWRLAGRVHHQRNQSEAAFAAFDRAATLLQAAGDHAETAKSFYGMFYIAWDEGRFREALTFAHDAAREAAAAGDRELESTALSGVFTIHYELGDLEGAQQAADAARALDLSQDRAYVQSFLGTLRLDQGRPALAKDALERVLQLATGGQDRRFFRSTHLNLVRAHLELGNLERAGFHLAEAWKQAEPEGREQSALLSFQARIEHLQGRFAQAAETLHLALDQEPHADWRAKLSTQLGLVEEARGDTTAAREAYRGAVATVEQQRAELGFDELKPWLLQARRSPFEGLFLLESAAGNIWRALEVVERAKARTLLDAFIDTETGATGTGGIEAGAPRSPPGAVEASLRTESLRQLLPALRESPVVKPRPIDEISRIVESHWVLVYFQARDTLWQIVVHDGVALPRRLSAKPEEVAELADRFVATPDDQTTAAALASILLPSGSLPDPGTPMFIAADRLLDSVPFAALPITDRSGDRSIGRLLVTDHAIGHVPSLNALAAFVERPRAVAGPAVVLGDPRNDLPAARREAMEVGARLGAIGHTGAEASLAAVGAATRARVLHLATHSGARPGGPWLALADGDLEASAIMERRLAPELVVLASCASASRRGLGIWGSLGATFLAAGSRNVLASLWPVEDEAARRFVLRFYDQGGVADPRWALARAQRAAGAEGVPVGEWAAFVVLGDG